MSLGSLCFAQGVAVTGSKKKIFSHIGEDERRQSVYCNRVGEVTG